MSGALPYLAMEEILAETLAYSAYPAVVTVVYALVRVVVPEFADIAVITSGRLAALDAHLPCSLGIAAEHTEHVLRLPPRQDVVFGVVVAETTGIPPLTGETLHLDVAPVVLATKNATGREVMALGFVGAHPSRLRDRGEGRPNVVLCQDKLLCRRGVAEHALPELERVQGAGQSWLFGWA